MLFSPTGKRRVKRPRSPPGTPGPHTADDRAALRQRAYPPASPASAQNVNYFRAALFNMPDLRSGTSTDTMDAPHLRTDLEARGTSSEDDIVQIAGGSGDEEQVDASPRRPRRPAQPDLEDALTRPTQTVERMAAIQQPPAANVGPVVEEDPDFNWHGLRSPLDATFPLPNAGVVQRIAAGLFAKLQAGLITERDAYEARFALDVLSDWEDMNPELRTRVFQRINLYAIVATHGWPTAIAATAASTNSLQCFLSPGVQPVLQQQRQNQQRQQGGGRRGNRQPPQQAAQVAPAPAAPAPAQRGGRNRRR